MIRELRRILSVFREMKTPTLTSYQRVHVNKVIYWHILSEVFDIPKNVLDPGVVRKLAAKETNPEGVASMSLTKS